MIEPGTCISLTYPDTNLVESLAKLEQRRVHVHEIRDLVADPLTPEEYLRRPYTRRSRWLIRGYDETRKQWRQFYLGSSAEYQSPGVLRVALYEPGGNRPAYGISRDFGPSKRDRRLLARAIAEWTKRDIQDLQLRIYADDLRRIG
jgi:hypothetical protein